MTPASRPCRRTSSIADGRSRVPRIRRCSSRCSAGSPPRRARAKSAKSSASRATPPACPPTRRASTTRVNADRIVLVHGFTQTAASWRPTVARLTAGLGPDVDIVALDAPGHGERGDVRADLPTGASMLGDEGGRATYIGYSMGGRLCLHLALASPHLVDRLVLIGTTPGIEDDGETRGPTRRRTTSSPTRSSASGSTPSSNAGCRSRSSPTLGRSDGDIETRLTNTAAGLASSLRLAGTGTQAPLWARLGELTMPVLVVAGEHDAKFIGDRSADGRLDPRCVVRRHRRRRPCGPPRTTRADLRGDRDVAPLPSTAERQPEREQRAVGELRPTRRSEHGDQRRAARPVDHRL